MSLHNDAFTCSALKTCCLMLRDHAPAHAGKAPKKILLEALPGLTEERATAAIQSGCHFDYHELSTIADQFNIWAVGTMLKPVTADGLRNGKAFERGTTITTDAPRPATPPPPQVVQPRRLLFLLLQSFTLDDVYDLLDLQRKTLLTGLGEAQNQKTAINTLGITKEQACQPLTAVEEKQLLGILEPAAEVKEKQPPAAVSTMTDCVYPRLQYLARVKHSLSLSTVCEVLGLTKGAHYNWKKKCPLRLAKFFDVHPAELNRPLTEDETLQLEATAEVTVALSKAKTSSTRSNSKTLGPKVHQRHIKSETMVPCNLQRIKLLAYERGKRPSEICLALGYAANSYNNWQHRCSPQVAEALGVSADELKPPLTVQEKVRLEVMAPKFKPAKVKAKPRPPAVKARLVPPAAAKATPPANLSEEQQLLELMKSPGWTSIQHAFYVLRDFTPGNRTLALNWLNNKLRACK